MDSHQRLKAWILCLIACMELSDKKRSSGHCLHDILPPVSNQCYDMRQHRPTHLIDLFYHSVTAFFTRIVNFTVVFIFIDA